MKSEFLQQVSWFDLVALGMIIVGLVRGRKHGMSQELLMVLQWLLIVVLGAMLYQPVGDFILLTVHVSPVWMYIGVYLTIAVLVKLFFSLVKRSVGEKLVGSDVFGRLEYYLGMLAGAVRFCCILLLVMAVLNAKYVSEADLQREAKTQQEDFGDISFPTFDSLQFEVFHHSLTGQFVKK
ncbi:MAG: CvpA family protein, partial [Verrucomicrobia bacterium]|nr:CvpA family protein [Verrucomicrobiota bacterium]